MYCLQQKESNTVFPASIYRLKFNSRNTRTKCEICSKKVKQ